MDLEEKEERMCNVWVRRRGLDQSPVRRSRGFFGMEVESMSPRAQVAAALSVLVPVTFGAAGVLLFVPQLFWLVFTFGWMIFPSLGLLVRGIAASPAELSGRGTQLPSADGKERELLDALRVHGELTPIRAAMETSLTVAEADRMLGELAEKGHLQVRARGGGLFYALWGQGGASGTESRVAVG
jgi:hypothetical protein